MVGARATTPLRNPRGAQEAWYMYPKHRPIRQPGGDSRGGGFFHEHSSKRSLQVSALTLVVLLAARDASGAAATAIAGATREALGAGTEVLIRPFQQPPSDGDAVALGLELHADAVLEVLWREADPRRATIHFYSASRWTDREIGFEATDAEAERGRTIGFAAASMMPARTPPPAPPLVVSPPPLPPPISTAPSPPQRETPPRRWFGAVDAAIAGSLGSDASGIGGALGGRWDFAPKFSFRLGVSARAGEVSSVHASSLLLTEATGLVWRVVEPTNLRSFGVGARADFLILRQALTRTSADGVKSEGARWLSGADLAVEGSWFFLEGSAIFAALGGELAFGATDVFVLGERVATISPLRGLAEAGIRVHF